MDTKITGSNSGVTPTEAGLDLYLGNSSTRGSYHIYYLDNNVSGSSSDKDKTQPIPYDYLFTNYYDVNTSNTRFYLNTTTLNNITLPTGSLNLNTNKIINCVDPTSNQDVATKNYVDSNSFKSLI